MPFWGKESPGSFANWAGEGSRKKKTRDAMKSCGGENMGGPGKTQNYLSVEASQHTEEPLLDATQIIEHHRTCVSLSFCIAWSSKTCRDTLPEAFVTVMTCL